MSIPNDQNLESYVNVYDAIPDSWEEGRPFLVENLKRITNSLNAKEIGFFLDQELLSGKQFFPGSGTNNNQEFRSIFRKVVNTGALAAGANPGVAHGITFDVNFSLISLWVAGTDSATLTARVINGNDVLMDATNIVITSPQAFDRSFCVIEYIQEL